MRSATVGPARVLALALLLACWFAAAVAPAVGAPVSGPSGADATPGKPLVLAHYYIWFTPTSWFRAKRDTPLAGRYASDDPAVIRRQIREAKSAGIDGFIVSWKSTPLLDETLDKVVRVAGQEHFKLAITYQGLDFRHVALPAARIVDDLRTFDRRWASDSVFDIFGRPLVVISGTPEMSTPAVRQITTPFRDRLLLLASEKEVAGYERVAPYIDGELYYWSSINPVTYPRFGVKLTELADAVRARHGLWIAPVAPGFDARLIGGQTVVDRRGGQTMRTQWSTALQTMPNAIGIISWNEFSENTYIEPSQKYGNLYLREVAELTGAPTPAVSQFDSDGPPGAAKPGRAVLVLAGFLVITVGLLAVGAGRRHSSRNSISAAR